MSKKVKSPFSHFFKEGIQAIEQINEEHEVKQSFESELDLKKVVIPKVGSNSKAHEKESKMFWKKLRSFFRNGNNTQAFSSRLWPALLSPMYTGAQVGQDFPVWIAGQFGNENEPYCIPLPQILNDIFDDSSSVNFKSKIVSENKERIIHYANEILKKSEPKFFGEIMNQVLNSLVDELEIGAAEKDAFLEDIETLRISLPQFGILIPFAAATPFYLFEAAKQTSFLNRNSFSDEVQLLKNKLVALLSIEDQKNPDAKDPGKLEDSLSFIKSAVRFDELSSILPESSSERMAPERVSRIRKVVEHLEKAQEMLEAGGSIFIDRVLYNAQHLEWEKVFEDDKIHVLKQEDGFDMIKSHFDTQIQKWTNLLAARRIGNLEILDQYQADIHDDFFTHFNWENFSIEELNICPKVILIVEDKKFLGKSYSSISKIISSNIPVKILALRSDDYVDYNPEEGADTTLHTHAELAALMLSHKNIFVLQATAIDPAYLFNKFSEGLHAFAPAFFYILNPDHSLHDNPYIWTSTTLEGEDFPSFSYRGLLGLPWGSRFEIDHNPQMENAWTSHEIELEENGEVLTKTLEFCFADLAFLNPAYHRHYLFVSSSYWNENLVSITRYLSNSPDENIGKVPFVWALDEYHTLQKIAVSWPMVVATQERLDFWQFLQENSGINNFHVTNAVHKTRSELEDVHLQRIQELKQEHAEEIQKIRTEEAGKVMENLSSYLLDLDFTDLTPNIKTSISDPTDVKIPEPAEIKIPQETKQEKEEEFELTLEAYIDTVLCTSCNECLNINKQMFQYNENKMAFIADASAGTFSDLVDAAEICPVSIIHPGSPLNPDEPDLEELIQRAAKFN